MSEQRKYFRYRFPNLSGTICTDDQNNELIPIDISHGGLGFYSGRELELGTVEKIHLLNFMSLDVRIKFCEPTGSDQGENYKFKVGGEFVDFILTPQKLIEFLEIHLK